MKKIIKDNFSDARVKTAVGGLVGFALFFVTSHPDSKLNKKIPQKTVKNVALIPSVKIIGEEKHYHLHHWTIFSIVYLPLVFIKKGFLGSQLLRGFIIGSIIQGLIYKDRFEFIKQPLVKTAI